MKIHILLSLVLAFAFVIGVGNGAVLAQGKFPGYTSGIQVQNMESTEASIQLTFYKQDGTVDNTVSDKIPGNGSKTYFGTTLGASQGFNGSVVISSDKRIAAISNVLSSDYKAGASYVGSSSGATSVALPLLMKENAGFTTWFSVQNAGSSTASVSVAYSDGTTASGSIPAGASKTFYQAQETHSQKVFSAVVSSAQPLVAVAVQEDSKTMFAYTGFPTAGSTNPVMPLINANNPTTAGYITGVQIQNMGTQSTDVTVSYTPSLFGTACTETQTIAAGKSATFALFAFDTVAGGTTTTCTGGERFVGSARVTANSTSQALAAIVNQLLLGQNGESYNGFDPAQATNKVVMPLIMDRNSGYYTGFNLMNVGTASTSVNCTFTNTSYTVSGTLDAGKALTDLQGNKIADKYVGSGTCTAGSGAQIVAVVNELKAGGTADEFLVYEGVAGQ